LAESKIGLFDKRYMKYLLPYLVLLFCVFANCRKGNSDIVITNINWYHHPSITEIRQLYLQIEHDIETKKIISFQRLSEYNGPTNVSKRIIYEDSNYHVTKYVEEGNFKNLSTRTEYFYDKTEVLRFALRTVSNKNSDRLEERIYFGKEGKKIWEIIQRFGKKSFIYNELLTEVRTPKAFYDSE
jgi:hypothetical protein